MNQREADIEQLKAERDKLFRKLSDLLDRLKKIETEDHGPDSGSDSHDKEAASLRLNVKHGQPVRNVILDALEDLGWATYSRELALYIQSRYGRRIPPARFGTLANDEMRAYRQGGTPRTVWLCFGLTFDRHQPIKRLWARSDWPLEWRIVAPTTGRIQHLKITSRLCDLGMKAEGNSVDSEMVKIIAADHARDLPDVRIQKGNFELGLWRDIALKLLSELEPRDTELRKESAQRLAERSQFQQLFGLPDVIEGVESTHQVHRRQL
jgi:hypothetical protein